MGAGLPAIAVGQLNIHPLKDRYRSDAATRQASSHINRIPIQIKKPPYLAIRGLLFASDQTGDNTD